MERQLSGVEGNDPADVRNDHVRTEGPGLPGDLSRIFQGVDFAQVGLDYAIFMLPPFAPVKAADVQSRPGWAGNGAHHSCGGQGAYEIAARDPAVRFQVHPPHAPELTDWKVQSAPACLDGQ